MLEITLKSLTLPERQEEADKYLKSLRKSYFDASVTIQQQTDKMEDLVQMLNHLESLYDKKWSKS